MIMDGIVFFELLLVLSIFDTVYSLTCNHCGSTSSWKDCNDNSRVDTATCDTGNDACYAARMTRLDGKVYQKGCIRKTLCNEENICHGETTYCKVTCCEADYCTPEGSSAMMHLHQHCLILLVVVRTVITIIT